MDVKSNNRNMSCGHDVSNQDTTVESRTVFCRLCDLIGRCNDAEGREEELFKLSEQLNANYQNAAKLVADMHRAAMGEVCGPQVGPVEDVAGLRKEYERLRGLLDNLCSERGAIVSSADCTEMEIAFARSEKRFHVDKNGMGYVVRLKAWLTNAERAIWGLHPSLEVTK